MGTASANTAEAEQLAITIIRRILRKLASVTDLADPVRLAGSDNRLANAVARGIPARQKLIQDEGGSLSAEKAAERLGISKPASGAGLAHPERGQPGVTANPQPLFTLHPF